MAVIRDISAWKKLTAADGEFACAMDQKRTVWSLEEVTT